MPAMRHAAADAAAAAPGAPVMVLLTRLTLTFWAATFAVFLYAEIRDRWRMRRQK